LSLVVTSYHRVKGKDEKTKIKKDEKMSVLFQTSLCVSTQP